MPWSPLRLDGGGTVRKRLSYEGNHLCLGFVVVTLWIFQGAFSPSNELLCEPPLLDWGGFMLADFRFSQ
jgi:hypothetical protein